MPTIPPAEPTTSLAELIRRTRVKASAFVTSQADKAGISTLPWMFLAILAVVELAGVAPPVAEWTRPNPTVVTGISRGTDFLWRHATPFVIGTVDPLQAWTTMLMPARSTWLAIAAVPLLLITLLAVTRQRRRRTTNARALRLVAVLVGRLVMVLYLLHLVATVLTPVAVGATTVNLGLLALIVGGAAIAVRLGVGGRPRDNLPTHLTWLRRASRPLAVLGVVATTAWMLQALPLPPFWPLVDLPFVAVGGHRALVSEGRAFLANSAPGSIDLIALDLASRQPAWTQRVQTPDEANATLRLLSSPRVLYVQALTAEGTGPSFALAMDDGTMLWNRAAGTIHPFRNVVLHEDPTQGSLTAVDELTGTPLWTRRHPEGAVVRWQIQNNDPIVRDVRFDGAALTIGQIVQVETNGTIRILRPDDGAVLAERANLVKAAHPVWVTTNHLVWTVGKSDHQLVAYASSNLEQPAWALAVPRAVVRSAAAAGCGPDRICLADDRGARAVDASTGQLAWQIDGAKELAFGTQGGDIVVWSGTETALLDQRGAVLARFPRERGFPLDRDRILLVTASPGDTGERERDVSLFHITARLRQSLGHTNLDPTACGWSDTYLACSGSSVRLWQLRADLLQ